MRWPADLIPWLTVVSFSLNIAERVFSLVKAAVQMKRASGKTETSKDDEKSNSSE